MSSGKGGSNSNGGGGVGSIPAASKKMVQSLQEIVNCPEVEIYAMLKECNMDPNEAVNRLLFQDPFHEVKSKREKKKENKDASDSRSRGTSSTSSRGGRGGTDRYSNRGSMVHHGSFGDFGALRAKPTYQKENGTAPYTSPATGGMTGNNANSWEAPLSDAAMDKAFAVNTAESMSAARPSSSFQSAWSGMHGQVSMADIVKMGRPHGKASNNSNIPQQRVANQHVVVSSSVPAPDDLHSSQYHAANVSEMNAQSRVSGSQHVPPDDYWPLDEEPPADSVPSVVQPCVDSEPYEDPYDRTEQHGSQSEEVQFAEDGSFDDAHGNLVQSVPATNRSVQEEEENSGNTSVYDNELYQNVNSYQAHPREVDDTSVSVSSAITNFQNLSLLKEYEDSHSEEDGPAVKIPDYLQVQSADCSHLSFGSFGSGMNAPFSGSFASTPGNSNEEEAAVASDAPPVGHSETRNPDYYEADHLRSASDGNADHRMNTSSGSFDTPSVLQPDMLKQESPEVAEGNQYSFPSSTANYNFENSQQLNGSFAHSKASSQLQGLPLLSGVMPYANSLPSTLLASNVQSLREPEIAYSQFPFSQSMPTKYGNSVSAISGPTVSIAEALKTGNFSAAQPTQTPPGSSLSGGPAHPQLPVHPYSQPSVPMAHFANMIGYPFLPQSYTYMPSAFQQAFAAGNSSYHQSLAAVLPQYKNSISVSSLPQSAPVASGYGSFGNSNSIPSNFPLNPPTAPAAASMNYEDVLSSQYKDASHILSLQQEAGSRTLPGGLGSTYYSLQGQSQQPTGYRHTQQQQQQQQQQHQHYGPLSGFPNFYHSQAGLSLEHQHQMSRDGSLGGSQGQPPKQTPQQIWQNY